MCASVEGSKSDVCSLNVAGEVLRVCEAHAGGCCLCRGRFGRSRDSDSLLFGTSYARLVTAAFLEFIFLLLGLEVGRPPASGSL